MLTKPLLAVWWGLLLLGSGAPQAQSPALSPAPGVTTPSRPVRPADIETEARIATDGAAEFAWLKEVTLTLAGLEVLDSELVEHAAAVLRLRGERLDARDPSWPAEQAHELLNFLVLDGRRFAYDVDFRVNVAPIMAAGLSDVVPYSARVLMLTELSGFDFGLVERLEVAWGVAPRSSRAREVAFDALDLSYGSTAPITASVFSLPSAFFGFEEAAAFLRSVHAVGPDRSLVVLSNEPLIDQLRSLTDEMPLHLLDSLGRRYTPWPRDPFAMASSRSGVTTLLVRPNLQAQRELDVFMARELVQNLPEELDEQWGGVAWTVAPVLFHGGHMLPTPEYIWVSVHTLLPRVKEILRVSGPLDLQSLRQPTIFQEFRDAVDRAAAEFVAVFNSPVRLVHALPERDEEGLDEFLDVLGGGDARDLDSIVTIVPAPAGGPPLALVGDLTLGARMLADAPSADVEQLRDLYRLVPRSRDLRRELVRAQETPASLQFDAYLDSIAAFLQSQGLKVERLPLLDVPTTMVAEELRYARPGFMIGWNNVVLQETAVGPRAEGFASGMPGVDGEVQRIFDRVGVQLDYIAPMPLSVMRDGGYRCMSNHVR